MTSELSSLPYSLFIVQQPKPSQIRTIATTSQWTAKLHIYWPPLFSTSKIINPHTIHCERADPIAKNLVDCELAFLQDVSSIYSHLGACPLSIGGPNAWATNGQNAAGLLISLRADLIEAVNTFRKHPFDMWANIRNQRPGARPACTFRQGSPWHKLSTPSGGGHFRYEDRIG